MKKVGVGVVVPLVILMNAAGAANIRYAQSGDWFRTQAADGNGWQDPGIPGVDDTGRANWGGNTITLAGDAGTIQNMQLGVDESGTLQVDDGGILTTSRDVTVGNSNNNANAGEVEGTLVVNEGGVVNVGRILWSARGNTTKNTTGIIEINSGGTMNVESHLWLGHIGNSVINISGTLQQNDGILGLGTSNAVDPSGGTATLNINDGGLLALNNINAAGTSIQPDSVLNINGTGQLTLVGDKVGVITSYIADGKITGNGVSGSNALIIDLTTNPGFTTVTATVPVEPNDEEVMISNIDFDSSSEVISFTWNSRDGERFAISYGTDLISFEGGLEDTYDADAGITTTYSVNRSQLLGATTAPAVFFQVVRLAPE